MLETSLESTADAKAGVEAAAGVEDEAAFDVEVGVTDDISVTGVACVVEGVAAGVVGGVVEVGVVMPFTVTVS